MIIQRFLRFIGWATDPTLEEGILWYNTASKMLKINHNNRAHAIQPKFTVHVISTDGTITAQPNSIIVIPHGVLTLPTLIDISLLTNEQDELHIYNHEMGVTINFDPSTPTIYTYGADFLDLNEPLRVAPLKIILLNGDYRVTT